MPSQIVTHLGQDFPWVADKTGHNQFTCTFTSSSIAYNISALTFVVNIRKVGSDTNVLQLTQGSGITNGGVTGVLTITLSAANITTYLPGDFYYYEIAYTSGGNGYKFIEGGLTLSAQGNPGTTTTSLSITSVNLAGSNIDAAVTLSVEQFGEIPIEDFVQALQFNRDKELAFEEGGALSFTLSASGNLNGVGIILKLNTPTSVAFSADFQAMPNSQSFDATKLNITTLVYFSDFDGAGGEKVLYNNSQLTAI